MSTYLDEPGIMEATPDVQGVLYTLVREWVAAGCPPPSRININFMRWSKTVVGILEHAGFGLPG